VTKLEHGYIIAYIILAATLCFTVPLLSLLIIMASLYKLYNMPVEDDYFLSFNNLLKVIYDASIKHKFFFKVLHKDTKRAQYRCTNKAYLWIINTYLNQENKNKVIINKVILKHSYINNA
jgi:hypothetical protein